MREKIALAVFGALIVLSLCGLVWYLFAGHSWNVAASTIDDAVGSMDGYTVVVYPGTVDQEDTEDVTLSANQDATSQLGSTDDGSLAENASADSQDDETLSANPGEQTQSGVSSLTVSSYLNSVFNRLSEVDIDQLCDEYREKGAQVLLLDTLNPSLYEEGSIIKRGERRIGVLYAGEQTTQLDIVRCMTSFAEAGVDFTICITPDKWKVERLDGIDIVICTEDENLLAMGESNDGTFYVDAPEKGQAGVVLISPSNVVSAKEIKGN